MSDTRPLPPVVQVVCRREDAESTAFLIVLKQKYPFQNFCIGAQRQQGRVTAVPCTGSRGSTIGLGHGTTTYADEGFDSFPRLLLRWHDCANSPNVLGPPKRTWPWAQEHVVKPNNWPPQNPCTFPNLILYDDDNLYVYEPCMNNLYIANSETDVFTIEKEEIWTFARFYSNSLMMQTHKHRHSVPFLLFPRRRARESYVSLCVSYVWQILWKCEICQQRIIVPYHL